MCGAGFVRAQLNNSSPSLPQKGTQGTKGTKKFLDSVCLDSGSAASSFCAFCTFCASLWLLINLQYCQKRFLRDLDAPDFLHPLLAFLLFLQQLSLARDVAAVTLRDHVLAKRLHRFARDDLVPDCGLYRHFKQLSRDQLFHLVGERASLRLRCAAMKYQRQ